MQYYRNGMCIGDQVNGPVPMELYGGSTVSTIESPWEYTWISVEVPWIFHGQYHGFLGLDHRFVKSIVENTWSSHG